MQSEQTRSAHSPNIEPTHNSVTKPTIIGLTMKLSNPLGVISPTLDAEVLRLLARSEASLTIPQLHAMVPDRSVEGIRKTLSRLTAEGIVDSEMVGRTHLYRLNHEHLAAPAIEQLASLRTEFFERVSGEVESWPEPPIFVAVFGSASRGDMRPDSDIDLFLVRPAVEDEEGWSDRVSSLSAHASRWVGNDVRALVYGIEDTEGRGKSDPVLQSIAREGTFLLGEKEAFGSLVGAS